MYITRFSAHWYFVSGGDAKTNTYSQLRFFWLTSYGLSTPQHLILECHKLGDRLLLVARREVLWERETQSDSRETICSLRKSQSPQKPAIDVCVQLSITTPAMKVFPKPVGKATKVF